MLGNRVSTTIDVKTQGTDQAVKGFADLNAQAQKTAAAIQQANDAATSLNQSIADFKPLPFDSDVGITTAKSQFVSSMKEVGSATENASRSALDLGAATEQMTSMLDSAIPGLGGMAEAAMSLNGPAFLATTAMTALNAVIGEMERQSEATRKRTEATIKAEADRAYIEKDVSQKLLFAQTGDVEARKRLVLEYAAAAAEHARIDDEYTKARQAKADAQAAYNRKVEELRANAEANGMGGAFDPARAMRMYGQTEIANLEGATNTLDSYNDQLRNSLAVTNTLAKAVEDLGLSQAELNAVNLAGAQGLEGAQAALEKVWGASGQFSETVGKAFDGIKNFGADVVKFAEEQQNKAVEEAKKLAEAYERLADYTADLTDLEAEHSRVLADRLAEEQYNAERARLIEKLDAAKAIDQQNAKNEKIVELQQQANEAEITAQQKFFESSQKNLAAYIQAEKEATADHNRQRIRALEDLQAKLLDLSSQRDVASFVNARRSGMTNIARSDEDFGVDAQKRKANYERQQTDLEASFDRERATRQQQLQQRIQQEQEAGEKRVTMADQVNREIALLDERYAKQRRATQERLEQEAFNRQRAALIQKQHEEWKIITQTNNGVIQGFVRTRDSVVKTINDIVNFARGGQAPVAKGIPSPLANLIPKFHEGTPYIEQGGLALLKEGEAVLSPAENARRLKGGTGGIGNLTIHMSVGQHVSQSELMAVRDEIVGAIVSYAGNSNS